MEGELKQPRGPYGEPWIVFCLCVSRVPFSTAALDVAAIVGNLR